MYHFYEVLFVPTFNRSYGGLCRCCFSSVRLLHQPHCHGSGRALRWSKYELSCLLFHHYCFSHPDQFYHGEYIKLSWMLFQQDSVSPFCHRPRSSTMYLCSLFCACAYTRMHVTCMLKYMCANLANQVVMHYKMC